MRFNAEHSNAFTNVLHSLFLFFYFSGALYFYWQLDPRFSNLPLLIVFACLFILKLLGAYAHYGSIRTFAWPWQAIGLGVIVLNTSLVLAHHFPQDIDNFILIFTLICCIWYFRSSLRQNEANFLAIAIATTVAYFVVSFYTQGLVQLGFLFSAIANVTWISMRQGLKRIGKDSYEYRYDNDIYHLMLIVATFLIFKGILNGDWVTLPPH